MKVLVVDASVAAKWVLPSALEPYSEYALRLLDSYLQKQISFIVPDLFWAEIGNVLWKATRTGRVTFADAKLALQVVIGNQFETVPSRSLLDRALEIAATFGRSFYDCLYVALADSNRADFVTADEKLVNSLGERYPVKWLGAL